MTATPAPGVSSPRPDWSPKRLLLWGVVGHLCLVPVALRHLFVFGAQDVLGVPLHVVLGALAGLGLCLFTALAGISYLRTLRQSAALSPSFLLGGGALLALVALVVPPFLSSDAFDYVARGQVEALAGANPYVTSIAELGDDPALAEAREWAQWPRFVMPYGPLTALLQLLIATVAPTVWVGAYLFKLVMAGSHVLTGWLVYRTLQTRSEAAGRAGLALYLWNPWLLLEAAGSGHNDQLMALFLAAMALALVRGYMACGTLAFGLAVLVKHGCAPIGPLLLALAWHRRQLRGFGLGVLATAGVTGVLALHYFTDPGSLEFLTRQVGISASSLQSITSYLIAPGAGKVVMVIGILAVTGTLVFAVPRVRDTIRFGHLATLAMVLFVALFMANFAPWYHLWWIPLVGLWSAPVLQRTLLLLGFLGPLSYLVHVTTQRFDFPHQLWQFALTLLCPTALILAGSRQIVGGDATPRPGA